MSIAGCGLILDGPIPKPNKFGLLTAINEIITPADTHWQAGVQVENFVCGNLHSTLPDCPAPANIPAKTAQRGVDYCCSDPFTVYASFKCPPTGFTIDRAYEIAQKRFDANLQRALESIFWTGITEAGAIEPSLATGNSSCGMTVQDLTPAAGAINALAGLAALENAIGSCWPGEALIHMSNGLLPFVADRARLVDTGSALYTYSGNRVIAGAGYPASGPANIAAPPGEAWMFASSQIIAWNSTPFFTPPKDEQGAAVDRRVNDVTVFLEQTWGFAISCCLFAIRVKLTGCDCC